MTSYLVYLLAAREIDYLGLYKRGNLQDANAWPYVVYPQLVRKKIPKHSKEYIIVNDAFIFAIIWFIEGDYAKRMSDEAVEKITEVGAYYIQFKTFTYLRVAGMTINPKNLPSYFCDRLIFLEIS